MFRTMNSRSNCKHPPTDAHNVMARLCAVLLTALLLVGCAEPSESEEAVPGDTTAAQAPATDIYLASLSASGGQVQLGAPTNITQRPGYDNQPTFLPEGNALLYTSVRDGQADTYRYDVDASTSRRVTTTPESEYSPTPMPEENGFSVVRVESDGTQRLWRFSMDGTSPELLLPDIEPVGYHAWANAHQVALFVLGDPATLQLADVPAGTADTLARDIGRSLQPIPGRAAISYVQHTSDTTSAIYQLEVDSGTTQKLIATVDGGDYHAWTPEGTLLMARDSVLYQRRRGAGDWQQVANLAPLRGVTRLAVSPNGDRIALVAEE